MSGNMITNSEQVRIRMEYSGLFEGTTLAFAWISRQRPRKILSW